MSADETTPTEPTPPARPAVAQLVRLVTDVPSVEPDASVVEMLETLLTRAKAGELRAVACVMTDNDGDVATCFALRTDAAKILGALAVVQREILDRIVCDE